MRSFVLTEDAAREIVKAGTAKKYRSTQIVRKPAFAETPARNFKLEVKETEVLAGLGAPETTQAVKQFPTPSKQAFLTGVASEAVNVVTSVKLIVADDAKIGDVAFVSGIECVDGQIVVTTKYLRLETTTQTVYGVAAPNPTQPSPHPTAEALIALGTPTTAKVIAGYPNVEKTSVVAFAELQTEGGASGL